MELDLDPKLTRVYATHRIVRRSGTSAPLELDCENIRIESLVLNGAVLDETAYDISDSRLRIESVPEACTLEIINTLDPSANTQLSGLYQSGDMLCTQCEAEGFSPNHPFH